MTTLAQHAPDLRDIFTAINTTALVVNVVVALYVRSWFKPITQRVERLEGIAESNLKSFMDIRENFLRKSRVDEEFRRLDAQIVARFDKLENKVDCLDRKTGDCRTSIAALRASLGHDGSVET